MRSLKIAGGALFALSVAACITLYNTTIRLRSERDRMRRNQSALMSDIEHYRFRDSLNGASVQVLTLRSGEFERNCRQLTQMVDDLKLKLRRVEQLSQTATQSRYQITTPILLHSAGLAGSAGSAGSADSARMEFTSPYISLRGTLSDGRFRGEIVTYDTLTQVVHRIPRRFLFVRWGTKELRQEIVSSNPHTRVVYSKVIKLER